MDMAVRSNTSNPSNPGITCPECNGNHRDWAEAPYGTCLGHGKLFKKESPAPAE